MEEVGLVLMASSSEVTRLSLGVGSDPTHACKPCNTGNMYSVTHIHCICTAKPTYMYLQPPFSISCMDWYPMHICTCNGTVMYPYAKKGHCYYQFLLLY